MFKMTKKKKKEGKCEANRSPCTPLVNFQANSSTRVNFSALSSHIKWVEYLHTIYHPPLSNYQFNKVM